MLHRVILGSMERFIGVLIEHYAGSLPLWLSPIQAVIIPIKSDLETEAFKIEASFKKQSIRVKVDSRNLTLEKRIREAEMEKIPYLLILGKREIKSQAISVRKRGMGDIGVMPLEEFMSKAKEEVENKVK